MVGFPAARMFDLCFHFPVMIITGSPDTKIGYLRAARLNDVCTPCLLPPCKPPMPKIVESSKTVFINGLGAARMLDAVNDGAGAKPPGPKGHRHSAEGGYKHRKIDQFEELMEIEHEASEWDEVAAAKREKYDGKRVEAMLPVGVAKSKPKRIRKALNKFFGGGDKVDPFVDDIEKIEHELEHAQEHVRGEIIELATVATGLLAEFAGGPITAIAGPIVMDAAGGLMAWKLKDRTALAMSGVGIVAGLTKAATKVSEGFKKALGDAYDAISPVKYGAKAIKTGKIIHGLIKAHRQAGKLKQAKQIAMARDNKFEHEKKQTVLAKLLGKKKDKVGGGGPSSEYEDEKKRSETPKKLDLKFPIDMKIKLPGGKAGHMKHIDAIAKGCPTVIVG